jgi:excisionase family DNA binding protein
MALAIDSFISVSDAADALGLSPARVRLLAANGALPAEKIGGRWLVERSGVERRRARRSAGGRRFAIRNAWGLLELASQNDVDHLEPVIRSRLRRALRLEGLVALAPRLEHRAQIRRYAAHPGEVAHVAADPRLVASGVSAARAVGLDLMPGREADGYISGSAVDDFVKTHALSPVVAGVGNVILRVVPEDVWADFLDGLAHAPDAAVALDLTEEADLRSRASGEELLNRLARFD